MQEASKMLASGFVCQAHAFLVWKGGHTVAANQAFDFK
jgi:hypothetical protein